MPEIEYGSHEQIIPLDDNGSFKHVATNFRAGKTTGVREYFEIRTKVKDEKEELAETIRFMKEKQGYNRSTRVEMPKNTKEFYYLIKCWEQ